MAVKENYTEELVTRLQTLYAEGMDVEEIAKEINKTKRSVIAKLVNLGVYTKPEAAPKAVKEEGPTKKDLLNVLERVLPSEIVNGLVNVKKETLQALIAHLDAEAVSE